MIEPKSIAEQFLYSTARITAHTPNGESYGTGFFYCYPVEEEGQTVPTIITNKHVIEGSNSQSFLLHFHKRDEKAPCGTISIRVTAGLNNGWVGHPDPKIDLCALPLATLQNAILPPHEPFYTPLTGETDDKTLMDLDAIEPVIMIGYPNGLWDHVNNLPLMRRGVTASHPGIDYMIEGSDGAPVTVIDMACFPGSSGSPVFVYSSGVFANKDGSTTVGTRAIFLGVLSSGPVMQLDGKIVVRNIPTVATPVPQMQLMLNLGYVIKPREIIALGKHLYAQKGITYPERK